ncbi:transcriptional regulator [Secundilactobacillus pentosiphilus]|uniref:Transcriptional regulator n=1 Tax=Secundilactobacillus pentosiphilus TaxID=1714682 RepID=A0A1Z5IWI2_9LACO|nr:transcriptional regulator [Secundilactobacillus pentosiphilus]
MPTTTLNKPETKHTKSKVKGELAYEDEVLQKIVSLCLDDIEDLFTVDGSFFTNVADKLVNTNDVTSGLDVIEENVTVVDVKTKAEHEAIQ